MKELVELIAQTLVDNPERVNVKEIEGHQATVLELRVAEGDLGKSSASRGAPRARFCTVLNASGTKLKSASCLKSSNE